MNFPILGPEVLRSYLDEDSPRALGNGLITNVPNKNIVWSRAYLNKDVDSQIWWVQSMAHHIDRGHDDELFAISVEIAQAQQWEAAFTELFPEHRFVIVQHTLELMTWYQAFPTAPVEDEDYWEFYQHFRIGFRSLEELQTSLDNFELFETLNRTGIYEGSVVPALTREDQSQLKNWFGELSTPIIHPQHRGVMIAENKETGEVIVVATKTIRTVVGPADAPETTDNRLLRDLNFDEVPI